MFLIQNENIFFCNDSPIDQIIGLKEMCTKSLTGKTMPNLV
jgi:hypothetical protein